MLGRALKLCIIVWLAGCKVLRWETTMCGIIGFLDKRGGDGRPIGRTLLSMLQSLSCRGPDSAGVALFGARQAFWVAQIKMPEGKDPMATVEAILEAVRQTSPIICHHAVGAYLRLEVATSAEPV